MAEPLFRIQAMPQDDFIPRFRNFDTLDKACEEAAHYIPDAENWHHVQVLDHHGECLWDVLNESHARPGGTTLRDHLIYQLCERVRIYDEAPHLPELRADLIAAARSVRHEFDARSEAGRSNG